MSAPPLAAIRRHWTRVVALGCAVHGEVCPDWSLLELAHGHGPSITERMQEPKAKGKKLPRMDWLVLGLCRPVHRTDRDSLDLAPRAFEARYGTVAAFIDRIAATLNVDVWALAKVGKK